MKTLGKTLTAVCLAASFLVASIYCCCFSSIQLAKQKHNCCATKSQKSEKPAQHDCPHCNSSFNADVTVKDAHQIEVGVVSLATVIETKVVHLPVIYGKSLFINGPPGPVVTVPLYIQHHALRI